MMMRQAKPAPAAPAHPPITTPEAAEKFCRALGASMSKLKEIIDSESLHLLAMNIAGAELLQEEKTKLASAYIRGLADFKAQAPAIKKLAPSAIKGLAALHEPFRASILENERVLESLKSVSSSLIRKTAERMGEKKAGPKTYSRQAATSSTSTAAAVAINKRA